MAAQKLSHLKEGNNSGKKELWEKVQQQADKDRSKANDLEKKKQELEHEYKRAQKDIEDESTKE